MEVGFCNLIEDGDVVLIALNGLWSEGAVDMAKRLSAKV
jgi:aspartate aminotransferase-like enzyme